MSRRDSSARGPAPRLVVVWPVLALLLLLLPGGLAAQAGTVQGRVTSGDSGMILSGATVDFRTDNWSGGSLTDASGTYRIAGIPAGRGTLRVRYVGHRPLELEVLVPAGRDLVLDLQLDVAPVALDPVDVRTRTALEEEAGDSMPSARLGMARAANRVLESTPGFSELGINDAVRGIPGDEPGDPGSLLYVRGAVSDLKLVHLDGAPVYAPFPLGGLLDPFAATLLNSADIYLGGAPSRYDGGLSYIMDLRTRGSGSAGIRSQGSLDILSMTATAEAGLGDRSGAVASIRGMHPARLTGAIGSPLPYDYTEGLLRGDLRLGESWRVAVTGFGNDESVSVDEHLAGAIPIRWGNRAGSVRLAGRLGQSEAEVTVAAGSYAASLPLSGERYATAEAEARRTRVSLDLSSPLAGASLRYGAAAEVQDYDAVAMPLEPMSSPGSAFHSRGVVAGAYAEAAVQPLPNLRVVAGGRADGFSDSGVRIGPRLSLTWLASDRAALSLAAGRYHQFLRMPEEALLNGRARPGTVAEEALIVGAATHVTAGLDQMLGENLRLGLEGYFKHFEDMPVLSTPRANASGFDIWLRRPRAEGITGWIGYSLAWVWSGSMEDTDQRDFTGRHLLSTGLNLPLGDETDLAFRFAYGAGLPYAGIPLEISLTSGQTAIFNEALNAADRGGTETAPLLYTPDEPFLRIDASLTRKWTQRSGGRTIEISPFVRLINSLGDRDALFYFMDDGQEEPAALGSLPMIPIVGMEWRF